MKSVIVYFSRAGFNYTSDGIKELKIGNTEVVAKTLQELTHSDIFKLEPTTPYSDDYQTCVNECVKDMKENARPTCISYPDISSYDLIYLLYPNFCGTMPMHLFTFLENNDFTNKVIKPLCTNEGSGLGNSISDIKKLCKAKVEEGLSIKGSKASEAKSKLETWIRK